MYAQMQSDDRTWTIQLVGFKKKLIIDQPDRNFEAVITYDKVVIADATKSLIVQLQSSGLSALKLWLYDFEFQVEELVNHSGFDPGIQDSLESEGLMLVFGLVQTNLSDLSNSDAVDLTIALLAQGPKVVERGVKMNEMIIINQFTLEQVSCNTIVGFFRDFLKIINAW